MSYPLRPPRNAVEYISSRASVDGGPSTMRTGVSGWVLLNLPMMSRQTPVPSGSIKTSNSAPLAERGLLRLAANTTVSSIRAEILAGVAIKNMYLIRIDRKVDSFARRPGTNQRRHFHVTQLYSN